jgi:hypothetical protein
MNRKSALALVAAAIFISAALCLDRSSADSTDFTHLNAAGIPTPTPTPTPTPPPPTLGNYADTTMELGANVTIIPSTIPTNTTSIQVSTSTSFVGNFSADPVTGAIRVTNAHHANPSPDSYMVTVRALGPGGSTATSFRLTVTDGTTCTQISSFGPGANPIVGLFSTSAAVGDLNNDGKQDLAIANSTFSGSVSIYMGIGQGDFYRSVNISMNNPRSVAIGDLNGDGNQDIAVARNTSNAVAVYFGNGLGNFTAGPAFGIFYNGIAITDFNQDGLLDIVTSGGNGPASTVWIYFGDGRGAFGGPLTADLGSHLSRLAIGDFNDDGYPDIAVVKDFVSLISIVMGDGSGGIASISDLDGGFGPNSVAIGDFNLDGNQDLAVPVLSSAVVAIRLGDGLGGFSQPTSINVPDRPSSVAVGDFDNDGRPDLAVSHNSDAGGISIRFGDGLGGFSGIETIRSCPGTQWVSMGDFNADGRQDIIAACGFPQWTYAMVHPGTCVPPSPTPTPPCALSERFEDVQHPVPVGWYAVNLSSPLGSRGWGAGAGTEFPPQEGNGFIASERVAAAGTGTISSWLMSPVVDLRSGGNLTFYTRTVSTPTRPDRLQVRLSTNGSSVNVGSTATSVGDFTDLLLDINPTYTVAGYPTVWTQFTVNLPEMPEPGAGRFALRYFVENGGPNGPNSDYIGVDSLSYRSGPTCPTPTPPLPSPTPSSPGGGGTPTPSPSLSPTASPTPLPTPTPSSPGGGGTPSPSPSLSPIASPTPTTTPGGPTPTPTPGRSCAYDYDGDRRADVSVFRSESGAWYRLNSANGAFMAIGFGLPTDKITPADFDGDGKTDIAVFRPSEGTWYWLNSSNGAFNAVQFGASEDLPTPADYDGDSRADVSVFRPSNGTWYRLNSSTGEFYAAQFGVSEDKPTVGDFDGDGRVDIAVWRPSNGAWYRLNSSNGAFVAVSFGLSDDLITPADFDGDGKTDIAVYRPSTGTWYSLNSASGALVATQFGTAEDLPTAADYDGDGRADISVFRPSDGVWYRLNSGNGQFSAVQFGVNGDRPTPAAFRY